MSCWYHILAAALAAAGGGRHGAIAVPLTNVSAHQTSPGLVDAGAVPRYDVFELTLAQPVDYGGQGNFRDIDISVVYTAPVSGAQTTTGGFYYDTLADGTSIWKARFAPAEIGTWSYRYTFTHTPTGDQATGAGLFECLSGPNPGFVRSHPTNPFRWQFDNGRPFVPLGFNDCVSTADTQSIDGGDRVGAFDGLAGTYEYLEAYADAGFNMFRFSQSNCSPDLADPSLTVYDKDAAMHFDWLMRELRARGFRVFYGFFGYLLPSNPPTPPTEDVLRFVEYSVNRWGPYVDVWELQNERSASDQWIATVAAYVRNLDPYGHPVTTSWQRPDLSEIEINAPHWYQYEDELLSDHVTAANADNWKSFGKPVIVGEQGNSTPVGEQFGNWLPDSALRMRLRTWTAFFEEISFLFWNTSGATNGNGGNAANIYLGPEERQYIHVLQWFADVVIRSDTIIPQPANVSGYDASVLRAYGLSSSDGAAVYLHHFTDHVNPVSGELVTIDVPQAGTGYWIDPATGANRAVVALSAGPNVLTIPDFTIDAAFFSSAGQVTDALPIAVVTIDNPQADGDLDNDGAPDRGPPEPPFGVAPLTLTLDASSSYDLDGGGLGFSWRFGDGSPTEQGPIAVHTYAAGNYLTTLTVTDDEGDTAGCSFVVRATGDPNPDSNDAPSLNRLRDLTVREGELVLLTPWAVDRELVGSSYMTDELTYSASNLPGGSSFGLLGAGWSEQFWWVPGFSQSGVYQVDFGVDDDGGASSVPQTVTITVLDSRGSRGDFDADGDVDLDDYASFAGCLSGPGGGVPPGCEAADFDGDGDADVEDFGLFQRALAAAR